MTQYLWLFNIELNVNFICHLFITMTFTISKLSCSLKNKINMVCCFLRTTHKTEPHALTNTSVSWYGTMLSRIYRNNKYTLHQILLEKKFTGNFGRGLSRFRRYLRCVFKWYCICPYVVTLGNVSFNGTLNVFVKLPMMLLDSHNFRKFHDLRSRYLTTGYRTIWVWDEVLQRRTFSLTPKIITLVMTYKVKCSDYKLFIVRSLNLYVCISWNLVSRR